MARLPINAYDNDRLKTRKVLQMLNELGVLPVDPSQRPTFLRDHRAAAILIDRALSRLAPQPLVERQCQNLRSLSAAVNEKFANAWPLPGGGGSGAPPAWARAGSIADIDFASDPPRAWTSASGDVVLADVVGDSVAMSSFYNPDKLDPGVGYGMGNGDTAQGAFIGDMITAFNFSFTVVIEFDDNFSLEYVDVVHFNTDVVVRHTATSVPRVTDNADAVISHPDNDGSDHPAGAIGAHKMAVTITASEMYAALDGTSFLTGVAGDPDRVSVVDPNTPDQPTDIVFLSAKLKRLTVYNPIRTEADQRVLTG
jgi:hypothetical protein